MQDVKDYYALLNQVNIDWLENTTWNDTDGD